MQLDSDAFGMPDMTYGWSKLTGELLSRHAADYGVHVAVFRPFSGYGEDQDVSYPFTSIIGRVVRKETPLVVWGSGDQERDFIHIDDVVEAVHALLPTMTPGEAVNLGTGEATSFRQLAELACLEGGHDGPVIADTSKPEGVFRRVGDAAADAPGVRAPRVAAGRRPARAGLPARCERAGGRPCWLNRSSETTTARSNGTCAGRGPGSGGAPTCWSSWPRRSLRSR